MSWRNNQRDISELPWDFRETTYMYSCKTREQQTTEVISETTLKSLFLSPLKIFKRYHIWLVYIFKKPFQEWNNWFAIEQPFQTVSFKLICFRIADARQRTEYLSSLIHSIVCIPHMETGLKYSVSTLSPYICLKEIGYRKQRPAKPRKSIKESVRHFGFPA